MINEWNICFSNKVSLNFCCMCGKTNYCGQTEPSCDPKASTKQGHIPAGSRRRNRCNVIDTNTTPPRRHVSAGIPTVLIILDQAKGSH